MGGRHYSFPNVINMLPANLRLAAKTVSDLIVLAMLAILVWGGVVLVDLLHYQRSPAIDLPVYYVYTALPLVSFLMALVIVFQIIARLRGARELGQDSPNPPPSLDPL
jgi:TRAP-type transport system small permease protein